MTVVHWVAGLSGWQMALVAWGLVCLGALFGFIIAALCVAAGRADEDMRGIRLK